MSCRMQSPEPVGRMQSPEPVCPMQSPESVIEIFNALRVVDPLGAGDERTYPAQAISDYMDVIQNYIRYIQFLDKTNQTTLLFEKRNDLGKLQRYMKDRSMYFTETENAAVAPRAALLFC